jgi:transcriptional regulator with XRE-family HTH domain
MSNGTLNKLRNMFPRRLARIRGERSQRQFAHNLGVFQQNVNRYENGTMPHANFLLTLAVKEGISLDWLLLGRGRMHYDES